MLDLMELLLFFPDFNGCLVKRVTEKFEWTSKTQLICPF